MPSSLLTSIAGRPRQLLRWVVAKYGLFLPHRPVYAPVAVPPLPPHLLTGTGSLDHYLEFSKDTFEKENDRKTALEGKAAQLLGQAGLILSLVGILTPLLADQLPPRLWLLVLLGLLFGLTMLLFTNAVYHASSLTKVWAWRYMQPGAENIFQPVDPAGEDESLRSFQRELIRDYYHSFKHNQDVNNQKADYLSFAANSFTTALLLMTTLVLLLSLSLLLKPGGPGQVR